MHLLFVVIDEYACVTPVKVSSIFCPLGVEFHLRDAHLLRKGLRKGGHFRGGSAGHPQWFPHTPSVRRLREEALILRNPQNLRGGSVRRLREEGESFEEVPRGVREEVPHTPSVRKRSFCGIHKPSAEGP